MRLQQLGRRDFRLGHNVDKIGEKQDGIVTDTGTFTIRYEQMTDDELLRVAAERETLVPDAVIAIDTELARRGFSVATAKKETKRTERKGTRRAIGHLGLSSRGSGKHFFGVSNYRLNPSSDTEEFDSTIWLWMIWRLKARARDASRTTRRKRPVPRPPK